jgi:hypothetical protein
MFRKNSSENKKKEYSVIEAVFKTLVQTNKLQIAFTSVV